MERVSFTSALKTQVATALRVAIENRTIRIPHDELIFRDFHSVRRTVTSAGHFRLSAPRREGSHADRFWAAALAVRAAEDATGGAEFMSTSPLVFARRGTW